MRAMRWMVTRTGIVTALLGVFACSGASSQSAGRGSSSGGQSSGGQSSSSGVAGGSGSSSGGDDGGSAAGDDASSSSSGGSTLNTSGWVCPSDSVLGGYSMACVSCLETMCLTQLQTCQTSDCATCEGPVFTCESQSCQSACAAGGSSSSGAGSSSGTGDAGGTLTGSCAGLAKCCGLASSVPQFSMLAASCTSVSQSNDQTQCQQVIAMLGSFATYCQ